MPVQAQNELFDLLHDFGCAAGPVGGVLLPMAA